MGELGFAKGVDLKKKKLNARFEWGGGSCLKKCSGSRGSWQLGRACKKIWSWERLGEVLWGGGECLGDFVGGA